MTCTLRRFPPKGWDCCHACALSTPVRLADGSVLVPRRPHSGESGVATAIAGLQCPTAAPSARLPRSAILVTRFLRDVPLDAAIENEETFGPVVVVEVVDTPEDLIAAANRTLYGPTSSIFAGDTYKAFETAPKVLARIVDVNSPTVNDEILALMEGVRDSGWGRTGPRSLDDFSDVTRINSHSGQRQYPV